MYVLIYHIPYATAYRTTTQRVHHCLSYSHNTCRIAYSASTHVDIRTMHNVCDHPRHYQFAVDIRVVCTYDRAMTNRVVRSIAQVAAYTVVGAALTVACMTGSPRVPTSAHDAPTVQYAGVELPMSVSRDITAHGGINACATEDSDNCYWDAGAAGNGVGQSFVAWDGQVYYGPDVTVDYCGADPKPYTAIDKCIASDGSVVSK